jgi:uncharacterized protein YndB with AHSA1/START domain
MSKEKIEIEFEMHASPALLYNYISTPSGLSEWFADDVNAKGDIYTFRWEDTEEIAVLLKSKHNVYTRFKWKEDEDPKSFFEMKIVEDELTYDVSLVITDFVEKDEIDETYRLWANQIEDLKHIVGS